MSNIEIFNEDFRVLFYNHDDFFSKVRKFEPTLFM